LLGVFIIPLFNACDATYGMMLCCDICFSGLSPLLGGTLVQLFAITIL